MNPNARAPTSSASGLFQFIEQTWLGTVKRHGAKHGYGQYADLIYQGGDGRWQVRGSARNVVLDLRFDPHAASTIAAHFLGPAGAAKLLEAVQSRPQSSAAALFPEAASANRSIFYRNGRPATAAEVHANLQRTAGEAFPASGVGAGKAVPELSEKDRMLAARLDRLKQDQSLLALLLGQDGQGSGGGFGGAFAPPADKVA